MTLDISDKQIEWINALAQAAGVAGLIIDTAVDDEDEGEDEAYGEAYESLESRPAPTDLATGAMPGATAWKAVATELAGEERTALDNHGSKAGEIAAIRGTAGARDTAVQLAAQAYFAKKQELEEAKLRNDPPHVITRLAGELNAAEEEYGKKYIKKEAIETEVTAVCLPFLDAPGGNPERDKLGEKLARLEALEKEIATPFPDSMSAPEKEAKIKERRDAKCILLNEMSRDVAEWMNRRMEDGFPPSREALAVGDIIQKEHQKVIKEYLDLGGDPAPMPPIADQDSMTDEELKAARETWNKLVKGTGPLKMPATVPTDPALVSRLVFSDPQPTNDTEKNAQMAEFRVEMLAAMARLMGSPSGRELLTQIDEKGTQKGKIITLIPGSSPACTRLEGSSALATGGTVEAPIAGAGSNAAVQYKKGGTDSYRAYRMDDGNYLYAPTHVTVAHEMVHAMHNVEGLNRVKLPMGGIDPMWNNPEEYWTIHKGDISEQTLRQDNGLSALRFGHISQEMQASASAKSIAAMDSLKELDDLRKGSGTTAGVDVDAVLKDERKFSADTVGKMPDLLKLAVYKDADAKGPLPAGWEPARLTVEKIKSIVADKLPFRMKMLGWTAYKLPYDATTPLVFGFPETLKSITRARVHNPRSAPGRHFKELGEKEAIDAFAAFKTITGVNLGAWNDGDWRANLRTLIAAEGRVAAMTAGIPAVANETDPARKIVAKDTLKDKLDKIKATFTAAFGADKQAEYGALFADDALKHFGYSGAATQPEQVTFLDGKSKGLATSHAELKTLGIDTDTLTLVERDKAATMLATLKTQTAYTSFKSRYQDILDALPDEDKWEEAGKAYADVLTHRETLKIWLAANAPGDVVSTMKTKLLDDPIISLSDSPLYNSLNNAAVEENKEQAAALYKGDPSIEEILSNQASATDFEDYLAGTPEDAKIMTFYNLLVARETVKIADAAQDKALVKAGFKQNTIVTLSRDAADGAALKTAIEEARTILDKKRAAFLKSKAPTG